MEFSVSSAILAAIISALTSALVNHVNNKQSKKRQLDDQLDSILKIAVQYPYLESTIFTLTWNIKKDSNEEEYLRYDIYCTLLFNYLERLASHYSFNRRKIEDEIAIKDWVRIHKDYWLNPISSYENIDSYDTKFKSLINDYLK